MFIGDFLTDLALYQTDPDTGEDKMIKDAAFFTTEDIIIPTRLYNKEFKIVEVKNCVIDDLRVDRSDYSEETFPWSGKIPTEWTWDTIMYAKFDGNLYAGSIDYSADITEEIRIKRRLSGTHKWMTIHVHPIKTAEDFKFTFEDHTNASNTSYDYAYIPLIEGEEGGVSVVEDVHSEFNDAFILDPDLNVKTVVNLVWNQDYNQETSTVTTIGRKLPYVIKNGNVGYYSGTLAATFMAFDKEECQWDHMNGAKYRKTIDQFLTNGRPKIIKDWQGRINMVEVVDTIAQDTGEYAYLPVHNVNWVEIGDAEYAGDLYDNGFINTDLDR